MRLGLGTVQFGLDYGVSNTVGQTQLSDVREIFQAAWAAGVRDVDTATLYGDSEAVLGQVLGDFSDPKIVTKTPHFSDCEDASQAKALLRGGLHGSLARLGVGYVHGLLIHAPGDLFGPYGDALATEMDALKQDGLIGGWGVSLYGPEQVDQALETFKPDMVQVPVNVFDQRLIKGGQLAAMKARGVEVFVRSLFLQGLALMDPDTTPAHIRPVRDVLHAYHDAAEDAGVSPLAAALAFAKSVPQIDVGLVGVNTPAQMAEILAAYSQSVDLDFSAFAIDDPAYVDPSRWPPKEAS